MEAEEREDAELFREFFGPEDEFNPKRRKIGGKRQPCGYWASIAVQNPEMHQQDRDKAAAEQKKKTVLKRPAMKRKKTPGQSQFCENPECCFSTCENSIGRKSMVAPSVPKRPRASKSVPKRPRRSNAYR